MLIVVLFSGCFYFLFFFVVVSFFSFFLGVGGWGDLRKKSRLRLVLLNSV